MMMLLLRLCLFTKPQKQQVTKYEIKPLISCVACNLQLFFLCCFRISIDVWHILLSISNGNIIQNIFVCVSMCVGILLEWIDSHNFGHYVDSRRYKVWGGFNHQQQQQRIHHTCWSNFTIAIQYGWQHRKRI